MEFSSALYACHTNGVKTIVRYYKLTARARVFGRITTVLFILAILSLSGVGMYGWNWLSSIVMMSAWSAFLYVGLIPYHSARRAWKLHQEMDGWVTSLAIHLNSSVPELLREGLIANRRRGKKRLLEVAGEILELERRLGESLRANIDPKLREILSRELNEDINTAHNKLAELYQKLVSFQLAEENPDWLHWVDEEVKKNQPAETAQV